MRMLLFLVAVLAAGYAGHVYLGTRAQTPYSAYSEDQLAQMEAENQRLLPKTRGDAAIERQVSLQLLQEERQRRQRLQHLPIAAGGAVLALIASILVRSRARSDEPSSDEESRFVESVGDPALSRQGARYKAAELLGVRPDAPPAVIEAALRAQLEDRDPSAVHGLSPELRQAFLERREALIRAGDLLLGRQELHTSTPPRQD